MAEEIEGGYVAVESKGPIAWYQGVIREGERIKWKCNHIHTRPEYNERYKDQTGLIWQVSAKNCGEHAAMQQTSNRRGFIGLCGSSDLTFDEREDCKTVYVNDKPYYGSVRLTPAGYRVITVRTNDTQSELTVDAPKLTRIDPAIRTQSDLFEWATAAWLLKTSLWGVTFQDHATPVEQKSAVTQALSDVLGPLRLYDDTPEKTRAKSSKDKPYLSVDTNERGKRVYNVIDAKGNIVESSIYRGVASAALAELMEA